MRVKGKGNRFAQRKIREVPVILLKGNPECFIFFISLPLLLCTFLERLPFFLISLNYLTFEDTLYELLLDL